MIAEQLQAIIASMATLTVKDMTMSEKRYRQIGDEVREYTADEYAQDVIDKAESQRLADEIAIKAADKAALLAKLGITADEAKLLLS